MHLFDAAQVWSTSCCTVRTLVCFVDGDVGFADVRQRPFQMGAGDGMPKPCWCRPARKADIGGLKLAEQRLPLAFNGVEFAGVHGLVSTNGCSQ